MQITTDNQEATSLSSHYDDVNKPRRLEDGIIKPLCISLFCGTGGSSLGYKWAGFKEILAVDYDEHAVKCFKANFPEVPIKDWDLVDTSAQNLLDEMNLKVGELDLFDASSPCVNLSRSNTKAKLYEVTNMLFLKLPQYIAEMQPKSFLLENVEGLLDKKNRALFIELKMRLHMLNYVWTHVVAKAEEYGVPQERRRVFFIGTRRDVYEKSFKLSLFPTPNLKGVKDMALSKVLPYLDGCSPGQFKDEYRYGNRPACTITKSASMWVYDLGATRRKPTIDELKILSSFPLDFKLEGSFSQQWARIGNAVPPKLTEAFARNLNEKFLTPYLEADNHTVEENDRLLIIADHFKRNGFNDMEVPRFDWAPYNDDSILEDYY